MPVYEYGVSETARAVLNVVITEYPESVFFSANTILYTKFPSLSPSYVALTKISLNGSVLSSENEISNIQAGNNFTASIITNNAQALITKTSSVQTVDIFSMFECVPDPDRDPNGSITQSLVVPALAEYTVTYSAGSTPGVTNLPAAQTKIGQVDITLSDQTPVRTGYNFAGWNTAEDGTGISYQVEGTYTADADITLYAQWEIKKYAINYLAVYWGNNPSKEQLTGSPWPPNGYKLYGETYTISNVVPSVLGFNFRGWTTNDGTESYNPGDTYSKDEPLTLYAEWDAYAKPKITGSGSELPLVLRSDSSGTQDLFGTYALVEFDWQTFASTGTEARLYYKLTTASTWTSASTITLSGTSGSQSVVIGGGNLDVSKTYNVRIVVEDSTGNTTRFNTTLTLSYMTLDFAAGGKAIGVGQIAPNPANHPAGLMQISMDLQDGNGGFIDTLRHPKRIQPNTGADLDTYMSSGSWYVVSDADAGTISNVPINRAGYFYVMDSGVKTQVYMTYIGPVYTRFYSSWASPPTWSSWTLVGGYDEVIEQGTSGIWHYEKWSSGKAVCYTNAEESTTLNYSTAIGNLWRATLTVSLPSGLFTTVKVCKMFPGQSYLSIFAGLSSKSTTSVGFYLLRPSSGNASLNYSIEIIGSWK